MITKMPLKLCLEGHSNIVSGWNLPGSVVWGITSGFRDYLNTVTLPLLKHVKGRPIPIILIISSSQLDFIENGASGA